MSLERSTSPTQYLTTVASFIRVLDQILDGFRIAVPPHSFRIRPDDLLTRLRVFSDECFAEFNETRSQGPLENTIVAFRATLYLCPPNSSHRTYLTGKLGDALTRTWIHAASFPENVAEGMRLLQEAMEASSVDDPFYKYCVSRLAWAHGERWKRFGEEQDVLERVRLCEEALARQPLRSDERYWLLRNLIDTSSRCSMTKRGNAQALNRAIDVCSQAISEFAEDSVKNQELSDYLCALYMVLSSSSSEVAEQDRAIDAIRAYCASPYQKLNYLAHALKRRFMRSHVQDDIDEAINLHWEFINGLTKGRTDCLQEATDSLAMTYSLRFMAYAQVSDLDQCLALSRKALALTPPGHPSRLDQVLSSAFMMRMGGELLKDPDIDNLDECILLLEEAVSLCPLNTPGRCRSLCALARCLIMKHSMFHRPEDLERVISLLEEALSPSFQDDERIKMSCRLADALLARYKLQKDPQDLENAITWSRTAVQPENLANSNYNIETHVQALFERFELYNKPEDIDMAIKFQTSYALTESKQDPGSLEALVLLSRLHVARAGITEFNSKEGAHNLVVAISLLQDVLGDKQNFPRKPFVELCKGLAELPELEALSSDIRRSLLTVFRKVLLLLPRIASFNLSIKSRLMALLDARNLAGQAALCAFSTGDTMAALELVEGGRGTFWAQGLQLRTQLDDVPPDLRSRLEQLSDELEQASLSSNAVGDLGPGMLETSRQLQAVRRLRTAAEFEDVVSHVRTIPGLERFMLPTPITTLARAATRGTVVTLIAGKECCHAIVMPVVGEVKHVRLSTLNTERLIKIAEHLRQDQIGARTARASRIIKHKTMFGNQHLLSIWRGIVLPIFEVLNAYVSEDIFLLILSSDASKASQGARPTRTPLLVCHWPIYLHPGTCRRRLRQTSWYLLF
jgi:tetratricopeptide (TPR) repeat protein